MKTTRLPLVLTLLAIPAGAKTADASSCVPGFDFAAFAANGASFQGNAKVDSYDSSVGTYAETKTCSGGNVGTNSTTAGAVSLEGSVSVCGDIAVGAGGNPSTVVTGSGYLTKSVQSANQTLAAVTIPTVGTNQGSKEFSDGTNALAPNQTYGAVSCQASCTLTLSAGVYVVDSISLQGNADLRITSAPVTVYFKTSLSLQGGGVANSTGIPANLAFFGGPSATSVSLQGGPDADFVVYAPAADVSLQGNADIYGAVVGKTLSEQGNPGIHYDRSLQNFAGGGFTCPPIEVSRAAPVVATIGGTPSVVQGSFESQSAAISTITTLASVSTFSFPYIRGHFRARSVASLSTSSSTYSSGSILFDASTKLPSANNSGCSNKGSCRYIFTNTNTPAGQTYAPPTATFDDAHASTIGALIAPTSLVSGIGSSQWQTIVRTVLAAPLGGIDRSIAAVIQPSPYAGNVARPTMAYVGGTDGMLHAFCASTGGTTATGSNICPSLGTELWAFMPRVQLPLVASNTTRIDGSVHVVDAFGDFTHNPATGAKSWRTIAVFQTGFAVGTKPAVYALDVTDPYSPRLIWEYAQPATTAAVDLGTGLVVAMGPTMVNGRIQNLVVAETNNGGTGGAGMYAAALETETGALKWQFTYMYPSPPRGVSADAPLPSGVPGGAAPIDLANSGFITDYVMGDLYGNLWRLDAKTGTSATGATSPLFQFSSNKKPIGAVPTIYTKAAGGTQYVAFASGGYVDPIGATQWSSGTQSMIAVKVTAPSTITETATVCATCNLVVKTDLASGTKAFSQALVVGTQLFLTTDSTDVNSSSFGTSGATTGSAITFDLTGAAQPSTAVIRGGATSIARSTSTLVASGTDRQSLLASAATTTGATVDPGAVSKVTRTMWLRLR